MRIAAETSAFQNVLANVPVAFRSLVRGALQLRGLDHLYAAARDRNRGTLAQSTLDEMGIKLRVREEDVRRIPVSGSTVIVVNHPFGMLDGLVLTALLERVRPDFKIIVNEMLSGIAELRDCFVAVDVFGGSQAVRRNAAALRTVVEWLRGGHLIVMFPSGEVSHWRAGQRRITDPPWNPAAARCALIANAPVVPAYLAGGNGLIFQLAGLVHPRLRTARLPAELLNKRGCGIEMRFGGSISPQKLRDCGSEKRAIAYLRARTYILSGRSPVSRSVPEPRSDELMYGTRPAVVAEACDGMAEQIAQLDREGNCVIDSSGFSVYRAVGCDIPALLNEIGRLREIAFRVAGEGTGRSIDLDHFDDYYTHLILWNKADARIAGAYRVAWTADVFPHRGIRGIYTSTLFRYAPEFFLRLGPAVELGRSFIRSEYQKSFAALLVLWQAIAAVIAARPEAPVLFGAVSISARYSGICRQLMVEFLRQKYLRADLARFVQARHPFRIAAPHRADLIAIANAIQDFDELPLSDLQDSVAVPVLLKQYLRRVSAGGTGILQRGARRLRSCCRSARSPRTRSRAVRRMWFRGSGRSGYVCSLQDKTSRSPGVVQSGREWGARVNVTRDAGSAEWLRNRAAPTEKRTTNGSPKPQPTRSTEVTGLRVLVWQSGPAWASESG